MTSSGIRMTTFCFSSLALGFHPQTYLMVQDVLQGPHWVVRRLFLNQLSYSCSRTTFSLVFCNIDTSPTPAYKDSSEIQYFMPGSSVSN